VVALADAWQRVSAEPVRARLTQPPADVSAMDGYALRSADGTEGATLQVIGAAPAAASAVASHASSAVLGVSSHTHIAVASLCCCAMAGCASSLGRAQPRGPARSARRRAGAAGHHVCARACSYADFPHTQP